MIQCGGWKKFTVTCPAVEAPACSALGPTASCVLTALRHLDAVARDASHHVRISGSYGMPESPRSELNQNI